MKKLIHKKLVHASASALAYTDEAALCERQPRAAYMFGNADRGPQASVNMSQTDEIIRLLL